MLLINNTDTNPYFNIAAEEFLLKETDEDIFMLYVDEPSVIVGKHQNALAEINYRYIIENNIAVVRRISGGGTVYHDEGNLNFTFIVNGREGHLVDFKRFTQPIIEVLQEMGIEAKLEGKNDIRVNNLKVSGNAEHVFKNRVLHHGTLLVLSDVANLSKSLKVEIGKYEDNAVKSIRSKVANINNFSNELVSVQLMKKRIFEKVRNTTKSEMFEFSENDLQKIEKLADEKFSQWNWNYAYSPKYVFRNSGEFHEKKYDIFIEVENGVIQKATINGLALNSSEITGESHNYAALVNLFSKYSYADQLAWLFF